MIDLKFRIEEAPDAKSFSVIVTEPLSAPIAGLKLVMTDDNDVQPVIQEIPLPEGFGHTILQFKVTLDHIEQDIERFEDGVYWFQILSVDDETEHQGMGFLAVLTNLLRLQNLNLDHRSGLSQEVEDAHFNWMIYQCAVWATEVGQTRIFKQHVEHLKKLLPYMQEINEQYDYTN